MFSAASVSPSGPAIPRAPFYAGQAAGEGAEGLGRSRCEFEIPAGFVTCQCVPSSRSFNCPNLSFHQVGIIVLPTSPSWVVWRCK